MPATIWGWCRWGVDEGERGRAEESDDPGEDRGSSSVTAKTAVDV